MTDAEKLEDAQNLKDSIIGALHILDRIDPGQIANIFTDKEMERLVDKQKLRQEAWAGIFLQMLKNMAEVDERFSKFKISVAESKALVHQLNKEVFSDEFQKNINRLNELAAISVRMNELGRNGTLGVVLGLCCESEKKEERWHALALENCLIDIAGDITDPKILDKIAETILKHGISKNVPMMK